MNTTFIDRILAGVGVIRRAARRPGNAVRTLRRTFAEAGVVGVCDLWRNYHSLSTGLLQYPQWIDRCDVLTDNDREHIRNHIAIFTQRPLVSVVVPIYNPPVEFLRLAVASVQRQLYPHWELCLADDASTQPGVRELLTEMATSDPRIKVTFREKNGHISAATNSALSLATGEFVALLDQDDELTEHALYYVVELLNRHPDADLIFSDEDKIDENGRRYDPHFKPRWNKAYHLSVNLISHLGVYRTELVRQIGGFRQGFEGAQDYDLALRVLSASSPERVHHIPQVLYHWRSISTSTANDMDAKGYVVQAGVRALSDYYAANHVAATILPGEAAGLFRATYPINSASPEVVLCLQSDALDTSPWQRVAGAYGNCRIVAGNALANLPPCEKEPGGNDVIIWIAAGATPASTTEDLSQVVGWVQQSDVGIVGVKVVDPKNVVAHGGYVVTHDTLRADPLFGCSNQYLGPFGWAIACRDVTAVSRTFMAMRFAVWMELSGFHDQQFPTLADVDLCLRARQGGYRVVWTPRFVVKSSQPAKALHPEPSAEELRAFQTRWGDALAEDACFSPNLLPHGFQLNMQRTTMRPWHNVE